MTSEVYLKQLLASRYKHKRWAQAGLFVLSVVSGTRMIYQVNHSNWLVNMQQVCLPQSMSTIPAINGIL